MVEVISIVLAVVSLIGSLVAAAFTGWVSFYIDQVKRRSETKALTNKYRDPLTLSAYELQSRFFGLVQTKLLDYMVDEKKRELVQVYTAFLVGQYFSWVYIFRRQAQFLRFSTDKTNKQLNNIMDQITIEFSKDNPEENAFMLWRGEQMAIGELMTLNVDKELYCMGYAEFSKQYREDSMFRDWFGAIHNGVDVLAEARAGGNRMAQNKVRRLQHLLIDLVLLLDKEIVASSSFPEPKAKPAAPECKCSGCPGVGDSLEKSRYGREKA